jgi:hypothetical protein
VNEPTRTRRIGFRQLVLVCAAAGLVTGGVTLANATNHSPRAKGSAEGPIVFPEMGRAAQPDDAIDGRTSSDVDRASARRISGLPTGWTAWVARSKLINSSEGLCLFWSAPSRPSYQAGPPAVCDTYENVRTRGLAAFTEAPGGGHTTIVAAAPPGVTLSTLKGTQDAGPSVRANSTSGQQTTQVLITEGTDPIVSVQSPGGGQQEIAPAETGK